MSINRRLTDRVRSIHVLFNACHRLTASSFCLPCHVLRHSSTPLPGSSCLRRKFSLFRQILAPSRHQYIDQGCQGLDRLAAFVRSFSRRGQLVHILCIFYRPSHAYTLAPGFDSLDCMIIASSSLAERRSTRLYHPMGRPRICQRLNELEFYQPWKIIVATSTKT